MQMRNLVRRFCAVGLIVGPMSFGSHKALAQTQTAIEYRVLATTKTSTMEMELKRTSVGSWLSLSDSDGRRHGSRWPRSSDRDVPYRPGERALSL